MYNFYGDYNTQFTEEVDRIYDDLLYDTDGGLVPHENRVSTVMVLTEEFVEQTGERPPNGQLERLSTYILKEDLKRRKGVKVPEELEYPHLSARQLRDRHDKEADWSYSEYVDSSGIDQFTQTRHSRIHNEISRGNVKL